MSKRVSNKRNDAPGARSSKTQDRHKANVGRRRAIAARNRELRLAGPTVPTAPRNVPRPPVMSRAVSRVKRFFSRGPK